MIVIFVSLLAAAIQMALLLVTARILGAGSYSQFSLIIAVAVFLSAFACEWLRMTLARQGGSLRMRFRSVLLTTIRRWTLALAATLAAGAALAAALCEYTVSPAYGVFLLAIGVTAAGNVLSDMSATYLRFTSTRQAYSRFALVRVGFTGTAVVIAAFAGFSGPQAALAFGAAGVLFGGGFVLLFWPAGSRRRTGVLRQLAPAGWSMASGAIGTSIALTVSRLALGATLPPSVSGGAFLAIDLATRGTSVLGTALSTWGTQLLFNGAHDAGEEGARDVFGRVSAVFLTIWFSIATFGVMLCVLVPLVTLRLPITPLYLVASGAALVGIFLLPIRAYLADAYLMAIDRHFEVPRAAMTCAALSVGSALAAFAAHSMEIAMFGLPVAVAVSLTVYGMRNWRALSAGVDHQAALFAAIKMGLVAAFAVLIALKLPLQVLGGAMIAMTILDGWFLLQVYLRFVRLNVAAAPNKI